MISRTLLRLRPLTTSSLLHHFTAVHHLSSSTAFKNPRNATPPPHSSYSTAYEGSRSADTQKSAAASEGSGNRKTARLSTVTWSPRLHNSVSLIGTVEYPLKQYANGRGGCHTILRVEASPGSESSCLITLEMWDELAERALLHLKQNDYIYISGELGSYTKVTSDGIQSLRYKVTAKELNYVKQYELEKNVQEVVNSKIETGENLGEFGSKKSNNRLHLWQILFTNPDEWYDNRKSKMNPKQPDFKHKSTGEALWFSGSDPSWVKKQVEILDSRQSRGLKNDMSSKFTPSSCVSDELLMVPNPTVTEIELNDQPVEPEKIFPQSVKSGRDTGENLSKSSSQKYNDRLLLLRKFFANPDEWYDNRKSKKNPKQPDFKHKNSGEAIWLNERDPSWVKKELDSLDSKLSGGASNDMTSKSSSARWVSNEM